MTPAETTLVILTLVTIGYFIIGTIWAIVMHRRIQWNTYKRAKWVVFVVNLNMWPECIAIWILLQVYKFIKWNIMGATLEQLLTNQKAENKLRWKQND